MSYLIRQNQPFDFGLTWITKIGEATHDTGMNFGIHKFKAGENFLIHHDLESVYVLLKGHCNFHINNQKISAQRQSVFDEDPVALHIAATSQAKIETLTVCEFAVAQVENNLIFPTMLYQKNNLLESEFRGKNLLNDTACRRVKTIFDKRNSPLSNLVIGEVITAPGRWSSYPPHHHVQPEIYHYRFTEPQGFGMAECGEVVYKVKENDTYKILNSQDHAQTAAPGYGMYYLWVIRHLENQAYLTPEFTQEHAWTKSENANQRVWKPTF